MLPTGRTKAEDAARKLKKRRESDAAVFQAQKKKRERQREIRANIRRQEEDPDVDIIDLPDEGTMRYTARAAGDWWKHASDQRLAQEDARRRVERPCTPPLVKVQRWKAHAPEVACSVLDAFPYMRPLSRHNWFSFHCPWTPIQLVDQDEDAMAARKAVRAAEKHLAFLRAWAPRPNWKEIAAAEMQAYEQSKVEQLRAGVR